MVWGEQPVRETRGRSDRHPCRCYCRCPGIVPVPNVRGDAGDCMMCGLGYHQGTRVVVPDRLVPVLITPTDEEWDRAAAWAAKVIEDNRKHPFRGNKFPPPDELEIKTIAYASEIAGARATGLSGPHWKLLPSNYRGKNKPHDIGERTDVKQTRWKFGALWIRRGDRVDHLFLHTTGTGPFLVWGWIEGRDVITKPPEASDLWLPDRDRPAWKVPTTLLHPLPVPSGS